MLTCHDCHRYVRTAESDCPFCGAAVNTTSAPAPTRISVMVLAMGLAVLGCDGDDNDDDSPNTTTTMTTTDNGESGESGESGETGGEDTTGDGDGDTTTNDPGEAGSDYGAPPPPRDADCWF
jgi:hypothetical protein